MVTLKDFLRVATSSVCNTISKEIESGKDEIVQNLRHTIYTMLSGIFSLSRLKKKINNNIGSRYNSRETREEGDTKLLKA